MLALAGLECDATTRPTATTKPMATTQTGNKLDMCGEHSNARVDEASDRAEVEHSLISVPSSLAPPIDHSQPPPFNRPAKLRACHSARYSTEYHVLPFKHHQASPMPLSHVLAPYGGNMSLGSSWLCFLLSTMADQPGTAALGLRTEEGYLGTCGAVGSRRDSSSQ